MHLWCRHLCKSIMAEHYSSHWLGNILWWCLNIHKYTLFHTFVIPYLTFVSITFKPYSLYSAIEKRVVQNNIHYSLSVNLYNKSGQKWEKPFSVKIALIYSLMYLMLCLKYFTEEHYMSRQTTKICLHSLEWLGCW